MPKKLKKQVAKFFDLEMWFVDGNRGVVMTIDGVFPGENSFVGFLNFLHAISADLTAVDSIETLAIQRINCAELKGVKDPAKIADFRKLRVHRHE
jgi:hypothetical protein